MNRTATATATATATIMDWGSPAEDAAEFSARARRVIEKLIAKGCDPMDIEVYHSVQAAEMAEMKPDAAGWFKIGRTKWGAGKTVNDRAYKFAHTEYARACYVIAYLDDTEIGIEIVQCRYGKGGQVRPQEIRVGAPLYAPQFCGVSTDHGNPNTRAARAALGM